jgi:hypothetical protein
MTTLLILFLFVGLVLYGLQELYQIKLTSKPTRTPTHAIDALAAMLDNPEDAEQSTGRLLDLGSGYGDTVLRIARLLPGWEVDGVEQNPTPWIVSNMRTIGKSFTNYRFFLGDAGVWPLRGYNIVFINQNTQTLKKWENGLARRLPAGTVVVTYNAPFPRLKPSNTIRVDDKTTLYLYRKSERGDMPQPQQNAAETPVATPAATPAP